MTSEPTTSADLPVASEEALEAARELAELWGGELDGDRLVLPVSAGLRAGVVEGELRADAVGRNVSRLRLTIDREVYRLRWPAVVVLLLGGAGAAATVLWPFVPGLLPLAAPGVVLAIVSWLLVTSRLRTSSPSDFLGATEEMLSAGADEPEPAAPVEPT